jgi:hypothetical protein
MDVSAIEALKHVFCGRVLFFNAGSKLECRSSDGWMPTQGATRDLSGGTTRRRPSRLCVPDTLIILGTDNCSAVVGAVLHMREVCGSDLGQEAKFTGFLLS